MRSKLCYFFLIIFVSYASNSRLLYAAISEKIEEKTESRRDGLSIDYLRRVPYIDYIIGPGDSLNVVVSREYPELTTKVIIDGQGTIYLPKLKRIFVDGLSISCLLYTS